MEFLKRKVKPGGLYQRDIHLAGSFMDTAACFADVEGTVCLISGGNLDCARYHILGTRPLLVFKGRGTAMEIRSGEDVERFDADPLDTLRLILEHFKNPEITYPPPFSSGLLGYLAYDLKDAIEDLPRTSYDDLELPHIWFSLPSLVLVHDKHLETTRLCIPLSAGDKPEELENILSWFNGKISAGVTGDQSFSSDGRGFTSNFDKTSYMACIDKVREYITAGDIYQVNMSQRFDMGFQGDPFALFKDLYKKNPAPFFAYINAGDHHIVSTSPERFIQRQGDGVETRPIKGTRPRCTDPDEDLRLKAELSASRKDDAELSMIVDLMRNDLGKVCRGGTVRVVEHKRVEGYTNVFHLISIVEGELDTARDSVDLIRATFPGGSITGCPKIRSMEIIDELETRRRHIYTGSIGYISFHDTMDFSIAIRTATVTGGRMVFSVGGGVVFDSDPADEYLETLHKGKTLFDVFSGKAGEKDSPLFAWVNGTVKPLEDISVPVTDPGFQYGHGFFETIRVNKGRAAFLSEHLERLAAAWRLCFKREFPVLSYEEIINQVVDACGLKNRVAAVKIMVSRGSRNRAPFDDTIIVMARPYTHRLEALGKKGLDLAICSHPRQSPLADHKSMNYQYYYLEGIYAGEKGCDESLIVNPDGSVSETNTANILFVKGRRVVSPISAHVLPGIMERNVRKLLKTWGYTLDCQTVFPKDMGAWDQVILTNSLMGAVPVRSFGGMPLNDSSALCMEINGKLL